MLEILIRDSFLLLHSSLWIVFMNYITRHCRLFFTIYNFLLFCVQDNQSQTNSLRSNPSLSTATSSKSNSISSLVDSVKICFTFHFNLFDLFLQPNSITLKCFVLFFNEWNQYFKINNFAKYRTCVLHI